MQVIVRGNTDIKRLLKILKKDVPYKPSRFLLFREIGEGLLLYNILTGEMVLLSEKERTVFESCSSMGTQDLSELIDRGFIIPEKCDEIKRSEQLRAIFMKRREAGGIITQYNILPTTCCNARCFYCYESGIRQVNMSEDTADKLVDFIAAHSGKQAVTLSWFGGEPTLGRQRIDQICGKLEELGISFVSRMISNGYLFDEDLVKHAGSGWHLKNIQITLDGTEEIYNRTKAYVYRNADGYQRVLRNIRLLLDEGIKVVVRINMDEHNADDVCLLIETLAARYKADRNFYAYVHRLRETTDFSSAFYNEKTRKKLDRQFYAVQDLLNASGWNQYREGLPMLIINSCMADDPTNIQCSPEGILGKCEDCIYEHTIGILDEGITDYKEVLYWREREVSYNECSECVLLPCCRYQLEHCPTKPKDCSREERNRKIECYKKAMNHVFEEWKQGRIREGANSTIESLENCEGADKQNDFSDQAGRSHC